MGESRSRAHKFPRSLFGGQNKTRKPLGPTKKLRKKGVFDFRVYYYYIDGGGRRRRREIVCAPERTGSRDFLSVSRHPEKE